MIMGFFLYLSKKSPISVSDQAGGFSFGHKKTLHFHVRLVVFLPPPFFCIDIEQSAKTIASSLDDRKGNYLL